MILMLKWMGRHRLRRNKGQVPSAVRWIERIGLASVPHYLVCLPLRSAKGIIDRVEMPLTSKDGLSVSVMKGPYDRQLGGSTTTDSLVVGRSESSGTCWTADYHVGREERQEVVAGVVMLGSCKLLL